MFEAIFDTAFLIYKYIDMIKKTLSTLLYVVFSIATGYAQQYDEERKIVNEFLNKQGISADSSQLEMATAKPEYLLFNSRKLNLFVLVATKKYHPNLSNPILAYGFEGGLSGKNDTYFYELIDIYKHQLNYLYENRLKLKRNLLKSYRPKKKKVNPLLRNIAWGQGLPYNKIYFRHQTGEIDKEEHVVGCVPVAMTQIMKYHAHPQQAQGTYAYNIMDEAPLKQDFSKFSFNWNLMKDTYNPEDINSASSTEVAQLMAAVGISVAANFGRFSTSAYCERIKMALTNFFGYSPSCTYIKNRNIIITNPFQRDTVPLLSSDSILGLTYRELDEKRPLIVSNDNHAFVCDGYDGEFLHFNLGWNGYCNGFYRIIIIPGMDKYPLLYNNMVIGIQPDKHTTRVKKVELTEAGTLESVLTDKEKMHLHALIISGELNGKDMKLIRRMAGAIDNNNYFQWRGELCHLDLSQASFKGGKDLDNSYLTQKTFNYYMQNNKIGDYQFSGCNNLKTCKLPSNLTEIRQRAFWGCHSLMYIDLPESVSKVGYFAFGDTYLLKRVTSNNDNIEAINIFNENTCILNKGIIKPTNQQ